MKREDDNPHACGDDGCVLLVGRYPLADATCRCLQGDRLRLRKGVRWLALRAAGAALAIAERTAAE